MNIGKNIFKEKMNFLLKKLCDNRFDCLTQYFIDYKKDKSKFKDYKVHREKVVRKWVREGGLISQDFQKSFYNYKISTLMLHGEPLFSFEFFIQSNLIGFSNRLDEYIEFKTKLSLSINQDFKYIYAYDKHGKSSDFWIDFYQIEYGKKLENGIVEITITAPKNKKTKLKADLTHPYQKVW